MRTIYLVRHGKPEFPGGSKLCIGCRTDIPLSDEGKNQIAQIREQFADKEISCIYTSPLIRCVESARILSSGKIPVKIVNELREIDMGDWDGLSFEEIRRLYPEEYEARGRDMAGFCPPGGESFHACQIRALSALAQICRETRGNVIVLAHAGVNRTLIARREKRKLGGLLEIPQPYGAVYSWSERIFDGMIVAAGLSSRMGGFKPLMDLGGKTFIAREIQTLRSGGVRDIAVITGHRADEVEEAARAASQGDIHFLRNDRYEQTKMFDSVRMGLEYFERKSHTPEGKSLDGIFFLPVDVPLFTQFTMEYEKWRFESDSGKETPGEVYCPYYEGAPGHPLLIRVSALQELLAHDGERGLKGAYERLGERVIHLDVTDRASVMDADTKEDFCRLQEHAAHRGIPDEKDCRRLLEWFRTPENTAAHCEAVADLAEEMGEACNRQGAKLDLALIRSGALLHDIAKAEPEHAITGARWLSLLGHDRTAEIVKDHMEFPEEKLGDLTESLIVYLADKMVKGQCRVTVEERFADKRERFRENPDALSGLERRYGNAKRAEETVRKAGWTENAGGQEERGITG